MLVGMSSRHLPGGPRGSSACLSQRNCGTERQRRRASFGGSASSARDSSARQSRNLSDDRGRHRDAPGSIRSKRTGYVEHGALGGRGQERRAADAMRSSPSVWPDTVVASQVVPLTSVRTLESEALLSSKGCGRLRGTPERLGHLAPAGSSLRQTGRRRRDLGQSARPRRSGRRRMKKSGSSPHDLVHPCRPSDDAAPPLPRFTPNAKVTVPRV
jgi:hypothetical protein